MNRPGTSFEFPANLFHGSDKANLHSHVRTFWTQCVESDKAGIEAWNLESRAQTLTICEGNAGQSRPEISSRNR